jgi:hypothetical protein
LNKPIHLLADLLSRLDWDKVDTTVVVRTSHIKNVLTIFLNCEISAVVVEDWANLIECREDLEYEKEENDRIEMAISELANPVLNGGISTKSCATFINS